jgi:FAD-dependent urate hydroxylase
MAGRERILIVGGGIAGLTVAAALRQRGFSPELVEREPAWPAGGAGIAIQPNAMRVLRSLGVETAVERAGAPLRRFAYLTERGETLAAIDLAELWRDVGRGDGARCRLGAPVTSLQQRDRRVLVGFNSGAADEYDLVIGADGIGSTVRKLALGAAAPIYAGQMAWRALAPIGSEDAAEIQFWMGDGRFFGLYPVSDRHTYFFCYVNEPER